MVNSSAADRPSHSAIQTRLRRVAFEDSDDDELQDYEDVRDYEIQYREKTPIRPLPSEDGPTQSNHLPPFGTPRTSKPSAHSTHHKHPIYRKKLNREMDGKVCEVRFSELLKEIPGRNMTKAQVRKLGNLFAGINTVLERPETRAEKEKKIYPILCVGFNAVVRVAKSKDIFKDVADYSEKTSSEMRPDLALYQTTSEAVAAYTLDNIGEVKEAGRKDHLARTAWPWMVTFVEVKADEGSSGFYFSDKTRFLRSSEEGMKARAQVATYATEIMLRQHRTHLYSFYVAGRWLRFTRWDRTGAVFSTAVNMVEDPVSVYNLIYRFARLERWQQGYDSSVELASAADINKLTAYEPTNAYFRRFRDFMLNSRGYFPLYKVECQVLDQPEVKSARRTRSSTKKVAKTYLIGRHLSGHYSPTGRATRGYCAFDLEEPALRFFKDQWRPNVPGTHPEWETYQRLKDNAVSCVATAIAGGDVKGPNQATLNHKYLSKKTGTVKLVERIHGRIVFKELGRPLDDYVDQIELLKACAHALLGHQQAWENAGVLHRDISVGNIMIDIETGRGFLNDWDLCKYKEDFQLYTAPTQPAGISGTWPFMSALTLLYPRKPHQVSDDLESFIYVLVYCAFRFHQHQYSPVQPKLLTTKDEQHKFNAQNNSFALYIDSFFYDDSTQANGHYGGGNIKHKEIKLGEPPVILAAVESPLAKLLRSLYTLLKMHYKSINHDALKCYLGNFGKASEPPAPAPVPGPSSNGGDERGKASNPFDEVNEELQRGLMRSGHQAPPSPQAPSPPSEPSSIASTGPSTGEKPLDSHAAMLKAFYDAFNGKEDQVSSLRDDKLFDQLEGLYVTTDEHVKTTTTHPSGSKRSGTELLSPTLKQIRLHGSVINLAGCRKSLASDPSLADSAAESASAVRTS